MKTRFGNLTAKEAGRRGGLAKKDRDRSAPQSVVDRLRDAAEDAHLLAELVSSSRLEHAFVAQFLAEDLVRLRRVIRKHASTIEGSILRDCRSTLLELVATLQLSPGPWSALLDLEPTSTPEAP